MPTSGKGDTSQLYKFNSQSTRREEKNFFSLSPYQLGRCRNDALDDFTKFNNLGFKIHY